MEEGTFLGWLKKDGDTVKMGEPLFTVESDKAAFDSEAIDSGILSIPATAPKPGEVVKDFEGESEEHLEDTIF